MSIVIAIKAPGPQHEIAISRAITFAGDWASTLTWEGAPLRWRAYTWNEDHCRLITWRINAPPTMWGRIRERIPRPRGWQLHVALGWTLREITNTEGGWVIPIHPAGAPFPVASWPATPAWPQCSAGAVEWNEIDAWDDLRPATLTDLATAQAIMHAPIERIEAWRLVSGCAIIVVATTRRVRD